MEDLNSEYLESYRYCFLFYKICNVLFFDRRESIFARKILTYLILSSVALQYFALSAYMKVVFSGHVEIYDLARVMSTYAITTQAVIKASLIISMKTDVENIIQALGVMWNYRMSNALQKRERKSLLSKIDLLQKVLLYVSMAATWSYFLSPFFETLYRYFILNEKSTEMKLPFKTVYPVDVANSWIKYILVYIFQIYTMSYVVWFYLGCEYLMIIFCTHLSIELILLQQDILSIQPTDSNITPEVSSHCAAVTNENSIALISIKDIIRKHQKLIRLSQKVDSIFNKVIFMNILCAKMTIGFFGFIVKFARGRADLASNFLGGAATVMPIFYICYFGEMITQASAGLADAAYNTEWYRYNKEFKQLLCFVIKRSHRPCRLTSMGYTVIQMKIFTAVMSTTWSYFSLLNTVYTSET